MRMSDPSQPIPDPRVRTKRRLFICVAAAASLVLAASIQAGGRELTTKVTELDQIPRVRPEYPVPNEPNMLFYIERSVNSNTVIYAAHLDSKGQIDRDTPIDAYWRWYNVDGHKKPLIFIERMLAYGVKSVRHDGPHGAITFKVAAVPERRFVLDLDGHGHPEALMQIGNRWVKLVYVYLYVDDSGLWPKVPALDIFGIDKLTGKPVHDYVIPH
jgi:hypothetical protein